MVSPAAVAELSCAHGAPVRCPAETSRLRVTGNATHDDCVAEGRLALILAMYQKEGLERERATVERRRRQAVGGTNKLSGSASWCIIRTFPTFLRTYFLAMTPGLCFSCTRVNISATRVIP